MDLINNLEDIPTSIVILLLGYIWIIMFINFFLFQIT